MEPLAQRPRGAWEGRRRSQFSAAGFDGLARISRQRLLRRRICHNRMSFRHIRANVHKSGGVAKIAGGVARTNDAGVKFVHAYAQLLRAPSSASHPLVTANSQEVCELGAPPRVVALERAQLPQALAQPRLQLREGLPKAPRLLAPRGRRAQRLLQAARLLRLRCTLLPTGMLRIRTTARACRWCVDFLSRWLLQSH